MGRLTLTDIVSLAKAGYSVKDVKELLETEIPEPSPKNPADTQKPSEEKPEPENTARESAQELPDAEGAKADDIDYKKLYEKEAEKVKRLQEDNIHKDASNGEKEDPMKAIDDILASFM